MAGADRLTLSEHIVFDDLMALARFALFPDDDLTLAALLRSPFCDVDDDSLYRPGPGPRRRQPVARRCRRRARRAARVGARRRDLLRLAALATRATATPFDFFARAAEPGRRRRPLDARRAS